MAYYLVSRNNICYCKWFTIVGECCSGLWIVYSNYEEEIIRKELEIPGIQEVRIKYKQNWINQRERMDNNRLPKHALNSNP